LIGLSSLKLPRLLRMDLEEAALDGGRAATRRNRHAGRSTSSFNSRSAFVVGRRTAISKAAQSLRVLRNLDRRFSGKGASD